MIFQDSQKVKSTKRLRPSPPALCTVALPGAWFPGWQVGPETACSPASELGGLGIAGEGWECPPARAHRPAGASVQGCDPRQVRPPLWASVSPHVKWKGGAASAQALTPPLHTLPRAPEQKQRRGCQTGPGSRSASASLAGGPQTECVLPSLRLLACQMGRPRPPHRTADEEKGRSGAEARGNGRRCVLQRLKG